MLIKIKMMYIACSMRKDIFDRVIAFKEKWGLDTLEREDRRFVEKLISIGKRNGMVIVIKFKIYCI